MNDVRIVTVAAIVFAGIIVALGLSAPLSPGPRIVVRLAVFCAFVFVAYGRLISPCRS